MCVIFNFILFFDFKINSVPVDHLIILPQQHCCHSDVVDISNGGLHSIDKAPARIHTGMAFHAEMPLVPFFCLAHLGITGFLGALDRTGCAD